MQEEHSPPGGKKLKVIDWRAAEASLGHELPGGVGVDLGTGRQARPGLAVVWKTLGALAGVFLLFVAVRGVQVYQEIQKEMAAATAAAGPVSGGGLGLTESFVSRPKAELAREDVLKRLLDARRTLDGNPVVMQRLLAVEKAFQEADRMLNNGNYAESYSRFEETRGLLDGFNQEVKYKAEAITARDDFLVMFNQYEKHRNVSPEDYEQAFSLASEGRYFLDSGSFFEAKTRFEGARDRLTVIKTKLEAFVERQLVEGQAALAGGHSVEAMNIFNGILEIEPDNETARQGAKRAETLDQVYPMLAEAAQLEEEGRLVEANDYYVRAFELDNQSARAQQGMHRTARLVKDQAFNGALADAQKAALEDNWFAAIEAYDRALAVYPEHEAVKELREEAKVLEFNARLSAAMDKAVEFENAREWELARDSYLEALDIDDGHQPARDGLLRTGKMIRTLLRYEKLLELALLETRGGDFQASIRYFNEAMNIKPDYLPMEGDALRLKQYLDAQSRPVSITILSDEKTYVSISGYELLGKLRQKTLQIMPGKYRIVGRRKGYEDVTISLQVVAGQELPPIEVIASKKAG